MGPKFLHFILPHFRWDHCAEDAAAVQVQIIASRPLRPSRSAAARRLPRVKTALMIGVIIDNGGGFGDLQTSFAQCLTLAPQRSRPSPAVSGAGLPRSFDPQFKFVARAEAPACLCTWWSPVYTLARRLRGAASIFGGKKVAPREKITEAREKNRASDGDYHRGRVANCGAGGATDQGWARGSANMGDEERGEQHQVA